MSFFVEWNDYLKIDVKDLDAQHKRLTDIANNFYNIVLSGRNNLAVEEKVLQDLFDYGKEHFVTEESLMRTNSYPGFSEHRDEHNVHTSGLVSLYQKHQSGKLIDRDILDFIKKWLKGHILKADKELGLFLNSKGIR